MIGQTISHYRILEKLDEGGMGVVYVAEDTQLGRRVALKFLPADLTKDLDARERFKREARAASGLDHASICTIYEVDETPDGQLFIAMAFYDGQTLKARLADGALEIEQAVDIARQVAAGLARAHEQNIVHRDIKPANLMITRHGEAKILDFGIAKLTGEAGLTRTGASIGTLAYMAPEQADAAEVGAEADLWALGVVLYEMIAGRSPFAREREMETLAAIMALDPEPIIEVRPETPVELATLVDELLAKDPDQRPASAAVVTQRLARMSAHESRGRLAIQEIHRRSLWQVLGIFLAGSWIMLQVVEVMTEAGWLPDWTPTMALVLLLIGLPVCLATAFVQEGMPGRERIDRFLTWRRAILGGVGAFALLGVGVVVYFVMWTTGIGPVGNLVAQGVIEDGERVILADIADATGEGIGDAVTEALRVDLLEASVLDLVEPEEIAPTLRLMQVEVGATLTAERARDVAQREGIAAVLDGEVASVGSGYLMIATLRAAESGQALASVRVTADGPDEVIASIDLLSQKLREKSGESLRTIRAGQPLEQVTTSSLDALMLYSEAARTFGDGRTEELLEQAVARDSTFAMAWRTLSLVGSDAAGRAEALGNAFRFRHRLQDAERYVIEALYYSHVDETRAMEAYQNTLRLNPIEPRALNNLAVIYTRRFDLEREEELLRRAVDSPERRAVHYNNLVRNQLSFGRIDEAAALHRDFAEAYPEHPYLANTRFDLLFAQGELNAAADHARERSEDTELGRLAYWSGRLDEARGLFLRSEVVGGASGLDTAYEEALVGDAEWARRHAREGSEGWADLVMAIRLASSGNAEAADLLLQNWEDTTPEERRGPTTRARVERASLYVRVERGDTARALETMQRLLLEWGCSDACWPFERARLHDRLNNPEQAIEQYERVRQPGYPRWWDNTGNRLHAMLRLGPLYEAVGDTAKAVEAYQRMVDQWADADARGQETVSRFRERIVALGG